MNTDRERMELICDLQGKIERLMIDVFGESLSCHGEPAMYTDQYWMLCGGDTCVKWSEHCPEVDEDDDVWWDDGFTYAEGVYGTAIYRSDDYTAIVVTSSCGWGNQLQIFDNSKEIPDDA